MKCIDESQPILAAKIESGGSRWSYGRLCGDVSGFGYLVAHSGCGCPRFVVARNDKECPSCASGDSAVC